jgi:ribosomal protein S17
MAIVEKKAWPEYFEKVLSGEKKFDLRINDFEIKEGDTLLLREWNPETKEYTGREISKKVTYILKVAPGDRTWPKEDVEKYGLQIMSLE